MPEDWGSSRTLSRVEVGGKGQNHHSPAAAASLHGARCPAVRYWEKGEVFLLPPLPPAGVEGEKRQTLGVWLAANILLYC